MSAIRLPGIAGRVAVVTGAARGIGRAIAQALASQGALVAMLDVDCDSEDVETPDPGLLAVACDVSDEVAVDQAIGNVERSLGAPSILVNNAAILLPAGILDTSPEEWRRVLEVNLTGAFLCTRRVVGAMRDAGYGRIVNIGSNAGKMGGYSAVTAYAASKAGLHNLTRAISTEFAPHGITANAIAPFFIETRMARAGEFSHLAEQIPVGRVGSVDDVAYAALFLASSAASYITAEVMDVNGGYYID